MALTDAQRIARLYELAGPDAVIAILEGTNTAQKQADAEGIEFKQRGGKKKTMDMSEMEDDAEDATDDGADEAEEGEGDEELTPAQKKLPPALQKAILAKKKEVADEAETALKALADAGGEEGEYLIDLTRDDLKTVLKEVLAESLSGISTKEVSTLATAFKEYADVQNAGLEAQATVMETQSKEIGQLKATLKEVTGQLTEMASHLAELTGFQPRGQAHKSANGGSNGYRASEAADNGLDQKTVDAFKASINENEAQGGDEYNRLAARATNGLFGQYIAG
jgi:hypothetical protein